MRDGTSSGSTGGERRATPRAGAGPALVLAAAALALASTPGPAAAEMVKQFRDWTLYVHSDKDGKLCYIASLPGKQEGNYKQRGDAAAFVTRLPTAPPKEEVSVQPGYAFKPGSDVEVVVDGAARFSFFSQGEHAWARTPKDDQAAVAAMRKGQAMTVRGTSTRDTFSLDTYSLVGFGAAHAAMLEACKDARAPSAAAAPAAKRG